MSKLNETHTEHINKLTQQDPYAAECCAISRMENAVRDFPSKPKRRLSVISWLKRVIKGS